jgi:hypothetical protein
MVYADLADRWGRAAKRLCFRTATVRRCSNRFIATSSALLEWKGLSLQVDSLAVCGRASGPNAGVRFVGASLRDRVREKEGATMLILLPGGYTGARAAVSFQGILRAWAICVILLRW